MHNLSAGPDFIIAGSACSECSTTRVYLSNEISWLSRREGGKDCIQGQANNLLGEKEVMESRGGLDSNVDKAAIKRERENELHFFLP